MTTSTKEPQVACIECLRRTSCITVKDGTTYRPLTWVYPSAEYPWWGYCSECQCRREAKLLVMAATHAATGTEDA